ncbi:MAG: DUF3108 domain-containing protein [Chitinophagaceae bacterium]
MVIVRRIIFTAILLVFSASLIADNDFCGAENISFTGNEQVNFKIFYNVIGLYVDAGNASFTVSKAKINNKPVYHIVGLGTSNPSYDWIFRVRDKYETYIDTATLKPYRFVRHVEEGSFRKDDLVNFNQEEHKAISLKGTFNVPPCIQDVLSAIYYARNIDFSKHAIGEKIPFSMFIDDEVYNLYIRYLGKEVVKTKYGIFNAIKFKPMLIGGTIFKGGELMTVWVSDDNNHVPLRIESPISVGSVKVDMIKFKNLRYPFTSLISWR